MRYTKLKPLAKLTYSDIICCTSELEYSRIKQLDGFRSLKAHMPSEDYKKAKRSILKKCRVLHRLERHLIYIARQKFKACYRADYIRSFGKGSRKHFQRLRKKHAKLAAKSPIPQSAIQNPQ
ncbi:MAG: hypothetical protein WCO56_26795 [Verrucomicrobiota bacterium]